jgi:hypothetical protein
MCWNAKVSLNTYIFGLFACIFAYFNNKLEITTLLFIQTWMSMQLIEYFIWSKTFSNKLLSQIAFILIVLQPIFGILSISNNDIIKYVSLFGYLCFVTIVMIFKSWNKIDFSSTPSANGHLAWNWLKYSNIVMLIWFMFLSIKFIVKKEWFILSLVTISAVITFVLYHKTYTWGSLWCWFCNFASLFIISSVFYDDICIYFNK